MSHSDSEPATATKSPAKETPPTDTLDWIANTSSEVSKAVGISVSSSSTPSAKVDDGYDADTDSKPAKPTKPKKSHDLLRIPRRLKRTDATIDDSLGSYGGSTGKSKAHRDSATSDLKPAGTGKNKDGVTITGRDHLLGQYPAKGDSDRISFANDKTALQTRDYSEAEKGKKATAPVPTIEFKARKLMNAKKKGKPDAQNVSVETTNDLIRNVRKGTTKQEVDPAPIIGPRSAEVYKPGVKVDKTEAFARRDAEMQSVGRIPKRFLKYSDKPEPNVSDSDSVSEDETEYSDLEDPAPPKDDKTV